MYKNNPILKIVGSFIALGLLLSPGAFNAEQAAYAIAPLTGDEQAATLSGWFGVIWGDTISGGSTGPIYTLSDGNGQETLLLLDQALTQQLGGVSALAGKNITVEGDWVEPSAGQGTQTTLRVTAITPAPVTARRMAAALPAVTGSKPWVSILCKYKDNFAQPHDLAFFQGMYANTAPGLDHYWREQSYGIANVAGSTAAGWYGLNKTADEYTTLNQLAADCIGAADSTVDFSLYKDGGINMMFNDDMFDGAAYGGTWYGTIDGVTRVWSITWEPPWAYADISVIEHEMGHGFGLPHSSGSYGATYDNVWDVMSQDRYNCVGHANAVYGCMGQHTIAYHKDKLGWIPAAEKFIFPAGSTRATIMLEQLALPTNTNYKMAKIPIGGSSTHFYSVEARRLTGYDGKLAGPAVIIHEVDAMRENPAQVVDIDGNGVTSDAGAMWLAGETFRDAANNVTVHIDSATATGFVITIGEFLNIVSPTQANPGSAGSFVNPEKMNIQVETTQGRVKSDFSVLIGGNAAVVNTAQETSDVYTLEVMPPVQSASGNYDLQVSAGGLTETGIGAVHYSEAPNPEPTVTSIQRASANPTYLASVDFTVIFSESVTGVDVFDFALTKTGTLSGTAVTGVSGGPGTYTVSVNTGAGGGDLRLEVSVSASISDLAGASLNGLPYTSGASYTIDKTPSGAGGITLRQGAAPMRCSSVTAAGPAAYGPVNTDMNGGYNFAGLAPGTYTMRAMYPGYLRSEKTNVVIPAGAAAFDLGTTTLRGGEANGDGAINIFDITGIISKFGQAGMAVRSTAVSCSDPDEAADINDDGVVNISDVTIASGNFGVVGPTEWK
jgi:M6 family metalloprotease-like protein